MTVNLILLMDAHTEESPSCYINIYCNHCGALIDEDKAEALVKKLSDTSYDQEIKTTCSAMTYVEGRGCGKQVIIFKPGTGFKDEFEDEE